MINLDQTPLAIVVSTFEIRKTETLERNRTKHLEELSTDELLKMPIKVFFSKISLKYEIIDGNHRYHVLKKRGVKKIVVLEYDDKNTL